MTHTPGPWHRNIKPARKYGVIFAGRNTHVARLAVEGLADDEIEANCDLITAAPDLLAALKWAVARVPDDGSANFAAALETIRRAEGQLA